jgi:hypothetical protein
MGVAAFMVINLVVGLAALSLLFGTFETLFGKPKLTFLRSSQNGNIFAFGLKWNSSKEPASLDTIRLRLFNPFGSPTQVEVSKRYSGENAIQMYQMVASSQTMTYLEDDVPEAR